MDKKLVTTLRGHEWTPTQLEFVYLPSTTGYEKNGDVVALLVPTLVSCDERGNLVWWDLNTRRPLYCWKAHDGSVLSLRQLGIVWEDDVPRIGKDFGKILTHGKDGFVRITQLFELQDPNRPAAGFNYTMPVSKKIVSDKEAPPLTFELPVNVLNFCNVDVNSRGWLVTPATQEAEGMDLYLIEPTLTRPIHNYKQNGKTGIIMKFLWMDDSRLLVGYESGLVVVLEIGDAFEVREVFRTQVLEPHTVTCLSYDSQRLRAFVASTGSQIADIDCALNEVQVHNLKHKGVSSIACNPAAAAVGMATWDGYFRAYSYAKNFEFCFKMKRTTPVVGAEEDPQTQRAMAVAFSRRQASPTSTTGLVYQNGVSKNIIRRNRHELVNGEWMVVGFEDGRLGLYSV